MRDPLYAYVGRQAIFDRSLRVVAYELLYRNSDENRARFSDANQATAATMINSIVELGLHKLVGRHDVFVNLPADFLLGRYPIPLPPERTWIEVLEDVPVTPALIASLKTMKERGYRIALDDFLLTDETRPLIEVADVIKVSILNVPKDEVVRQYNELIGLGVPLLAEKVSTPEEMAYLKGELQFQLFQGHFLELPVVEKTRRLPHNRAGLLTLLSKLYDPKVDLRQVESMITADVGLSVRLLRLASSVAMKGSIPIGTIGQAVARLGTEQLAALVLVVLASGFDDKPIELARQALVRARMCEVLARQSGSASTPPDQLFTAGLLSLIDAILDQPLAEVLDQLPLTAVITDALQGLPTAGGGAKILEVARSQDRGDFKRVQATGIPAPAVFVAWFEAIRWADELIASM